MPHSCAWGNRGPGRIVGQATEESDRRPLGWVRMDYAADMQEETAPPFESWNEHLRGLDDQQMIELAKDYRWLDEEARPQEERAEFRSRREAVLAECER